MTATLLHEAGFGDLVSVIPPRAELAPQTAVKAESRGKAPGRMRLDGKWVGYAFTQEPLPTPAEVAMWDKKWKANVGLLAARFPGVDLDVEDPTLSLVLQREALRVLGPAPVRTSRDPRRLLVYRTAEPFAKMTLLIQYKGVEHKVEVLGSGQQYVVHGGHPSGVDYGWEGKPLHEWGAMSLTPITPADVQVFFQSVKDKLKGKAEVTIKGDGNLTPVEVVPQEDLLAPSLVNLRALVSQMPNEYPTREEYITFGHAVKAAAGGDAGYDIFLEWAQRWTSGTNEEEEVRSDWRRMHPPFRVGWDWLQREAGGIPAAEEFEADPSAPPLAPPPVTSNVLQYTDTWVVEKLAHSLQTRLRFVPETGYWHIWDGHAWGVDRRNRADYVVRQGLVALSAEVRSLAAQDPNEERQEKTMKWANSLQGRSALTKALPEIQSHPKMTLLMEDFDKDPMLLNTPGGVVDLRTGAVKASAPEFLMAKSTVVAPAPGPRPLWDAFLDEATGGDKELQRFLQRQLGYSLTGLTQEQTLTFMHGPPLTGKSVYIEAVSGILGSYHETAPADTFAAAKGDRHPTDLAKLAGARLVTAVETQEGRAWDTQRVKSITGGDRIAARFMRQDFFEFRPTFKILIVGNHEPEVKGVDDALMRRIHVVPFEHSPKQVNRLLGEQLQKEWPQILQWAIEGCLLWLKDGLAPPVSVLTRTARYKAEEDVVGLFLEERCDFLDTEATITRQDFYNAWCQWCHQQGEDAGSLKQLKRRFDAKMKMFNISDKRVSAGGARVWGYKGVKIKDPDLEELI